MLIEILHTGLSYTDFSACLHTVLTKKYRVSRKIVEGHFVIKITLLELWRITTADLSDNKTGLPRLEVRIM